MKKLYYVIDCGKNDEWTIGKYESKEEAIKAARTEWDKLTANEKKTHDIEVRQYVEDIENEDCDNFDYDLIDWGLTNREEVVDKIAEIIANHRFTAPDYQVDIYLYVDNGSNGRVSTFVNVGGNSWLDDDHYTVHSMTQYHADELVKDYYRDGGIESLAWAVELEESALVEEVGSSSYGDVFDYVYEKYNDKLKDDYLSDNPDDLREEAEIIIELWEERLLDDARKIW